MIMSGIALLLDMGPLTASQVSDMNSWILGVLSVPLERDGSRREKRAKKSPQPAEPPSVPHAQNPIRHGARGLHPPAILPAISQVICHNQKIKNNRSAV